jgi:hypothetical protein
MSNPSRPFISSETNSSVKRAKNISSTGDPLMMRSSMPEKPANYVMGSYDVDDVIHLDDVDDVINHNNVVQNVTNQNSIEDNINLNKVDIVISLDDNEDGVGLKNVIIHNVGDNFIDLDKNKVTKTGTSEADVKASSTSGNSSLKCKKCFKLFPKLSQLIDHVKEVHLRMK